MRLMFSLETDFDIRWMAPIFCKNSKGKIAKVIWFNLSA